MKRWLWVFLCLFLVACGNEEEPEIGKYGRAAEKYLEKKDYQVVSYNGEYANKLEKKNLLEDHEQSLWALQFVSPDAYIGKTLYYEHFIVKNHPIDALSDFGLTAVTVIVVDGKVIGGTSMPLSDGSLMGTGYSLNGESVEDIYPNLQEWREAWEEKYSE